MDEARGGHAGSGCAAATGHSNADCRCLCSGCDEQRMDGACTCSTRGYCSTVCRCISFFCTPSAVAGAKRVRDQTVQDGDHRGDGCVCDHHLREAAARFPYTDRAWSKDEDSTVVRMYNAGFAQTTG